MVEELGRSHTFDEKHDSLFWQGLLNIIFLQMTYLSFKKLFKGNIFRMKIDHFFDYRLRRETRNEK